ncbi:MAG: two-component sensor histidine kinase [Pirellulaceae bacterium]|nr:MAG: two-component sensor histidine kinase [Pirellulaceae bacterium]
MTRLFLRFYLGVVTVLIVAWFVQGFLYTQLNVAENVQVIEQALAGGIRLAIQRLDAAYREGGEPAQAAALESMQEDFDYPVRVVPLEQYPLSSRLRQRLQQGEIVYLYRQGAHMIGLLEQQEAIGLFGPLPALVGPSVPQMMTGFGAVLLVAALAIAILLRPVAFQMRAIEKAAASIAQGDFSARAPVDSKRRPLSLATAFNTMAERTEKLLVTQRELLQAVSHELRTPLARIRFACDLLAENSGPLSSNEHLHTIDQAISELDDLVGELLSYVRMESLDPRERFAPIDVATLIEEVLRHRRQVFPTIEFRLQVVLDSAVLIGDLTSIERALGNLVSNAGRFARRQVMITLHGHRDQLRIDVDDDGPGIPENERQHVLEPFVRLPGSPGRGVGLGLALVKRIAQWHQGTVEITDSPLGGARVRLTFANAYHPIAQTRETG